MYASFLGRGGGVGVACGWRAGGVQRLSSEWTATFVSLVLAKNDTFAVVVIVVIVVVIIIIVIIVVIVVVIILAYILNEF